MLGAIKEAHEKVALIRGRGEEIVFTQLESV